MKTRLDDLYRKMQELGWSIKEVAKRGNLPTTITKNFFRGTFYHEDLDAIISNVLGMPKDSSQSKEKEDGEEQVRSNAQPLLGDKEIPMKKCPYCAEEIREEAIKCKHCGEWIKESNPPIPVSSLTAFEWEIPPEGIELETVLGEIEKTLIRNALQMSHGYKHKAAKLLNVTMRSFRYRLEKLGLAR